VQDSENAKVLELSSSISLAARRKSDAAFGRGEQCTQALKKRSTTHLDRRPEPALQIA
jgi:hypothetical protein